MKTFTSPRGLNSPTHLPGSLRRLSNRHFIAPVKPTECEGPHKKCPFPIKTDRALASTHTCDEDPKFLTVMALASRTALNTPWQRRGKGWFGQFPKRFRGLLTEPPQEPVVEVAQTLTPCRFAAVPLGKGDNKSPDLRQVIVPLTKGDSREAAGGQGLSHFYHGLLGERTGATEIVFAAESVTAEYERLKKLGCSFVRDPREVTPGPWAAVFS